MGAKTLTQRDQLVSNRTTDYNYNTMERADSGQRVVVLSGQKAKKCLKIFFGILIGLLVLALVVYITLPLVFYFSSTVRRNLLFMGFATSAEGLSDPAKFGLNCSGNFFLTSDPGIRIGSWYSQSSNQDCVIDTTWYPGNQTKVILYLHGVTKTRASINRVQLLKRLAWEVGAHVVAIDYRGFGDSTNELPSLEGVRADAVAAYLHIRKTIPKERIIVWGHSLGTSITMYLAAELQNINENPAAIVLEAALDNLGDVALNNRLATPYLWLPCAKAMLAAPFMNDPTTAFNSTAQVKYLSPNVPLLMLHAEDDATVPYKNGFSLYNTILESRKGVSTAKSVTFVPFSASHGYGHSGIPFYPGLGSLVLKFFASLDQTQSSTISPPL